MMVEDIKSNKNIYNDLTKWNWLDDMYKQEQMIKKYPQLLKFRNSNNFVKNQLLKITK